jgi:hypothetical protein
MHKREIFFHEILNGIREMAVAKGWRMLVLYPGRGYTGTGYIIDRGHIEIVFDFNFSETGLALDMRERNKAPKQSSQTEYSDHIGIIKLMARLEEAIFGVAK